MNSDTAGLAVSLPSGGCATVGVRKWFPVAAKAADPVPAPSDFEEESPVHR